MNFKTLEEENEYFKKRKVDQYKEYLQKAQEDGYKDPLERRKWENSLPCSGIIRMKLPEKTLDKHYL